MIYGQHSSHSTQEQIYTLIFQAESKYYRQVIPTSIISNTVIQEFKTPPNYRHKIAAYTTEDEWRAWLKLRVRFPLQNRSTRIKHTNECTQAGRGVTHTLHATRLADWWSSLAMDWQAECQGRNAADWQKAGVMAALWYHLLVITPDSILFPYQSKYLYITMAVENQPFHLPIYSYSYLLFIYNNPDWLF